MNLQPHACASPLPRVLFPHPMKPHNVMIILIPIASKKMYMKIRTTQSPFCLLLMQDAAPGLPYYTASAGHLQMPSFVIAYAITRNRRMRSSFFIYFFFYIINFRTM